MLLVRNRRGRRSASPLSHDLVESESLLCGQKAGSAGIDSAGIGRAGIGSQCVVPAHVFEMDLEEYRVAEGLTWQQLAERVGISDASQVRRIAIGVTWPRVELLEVIIQATGGRVGLMPMHKRRLAWSRENSANRLRSM